VAQVAGVGPGPAMPGIFAADDEAGRDLAVVDWAATPLGPPGSWPQSLQTAVDILLSSRFSMWMAWGPQLTFFCNAACRRGTLGRKYPWALGRRAAGTGGRRPVRDQSRIPPQRPGSEAGPRFHIQDPSLCCGFRSAITS
jgi:hypothetical protein